MNELSAIDKQHMSRWKHNHGVKSSAGHWVSAGAPVQFSTTKKIAWPYVTARPVTPLNIHSKNDAKYQQ